VPTIINRISDRLFCKQTCIRSISAYFIMILYFLCSSRTCPPVVERNANVRPLTGTEFRGTSDADIHLIKRRQSKCYDRMIKVPYRFGARTNSNTYRSLALCVRVCLANVRLNICGKNEMRSESFMFRFGTSHWRFRLTSISARSIFFFSESCRHILIQITSASEQNKTHSCCVVFAVLDADWIR